MPHPFERYRPLIDDWPAFTAACAEPLPPCIWTNPLRATPEQVSDALSDIRPRPLSWYPGAFQFAAGTNLGNRLSYLAGWYHIQEAAALTPVRLLRPRPGDVVLDLCAAPGNKTAQLAVAVGPRGRVHANDRHPMRAHIIRTTLDRLGLFNTVVTHGDAANFTLDVWFDAVLADVPCSCEGTSRKHPDAVTRTAPDARRRLQTTQVRILRNAVHHCRPGGKVIYATCTYAPEENEAVVARVLEERDDVQLVPVSLPGLCSDPGLTRWMGEDFPPSLVHAMRLWPHHNDTGGFFAAVLQRS